MRVFVGLSTADPHAGVLNEPQWTGYRRQPYCEFDIEKLLGARDVVDGRVKLHPEWPVEWKVDRADIVKAVFLTDEIGKVICIRAQNHMVWADDLVTLRESDHGEFIDLASMRG